MLFCLNIPSLGEQFAIFSELVPVTETDIYWVLEAEEQDQAAASVKVLGLSRVTTQGASECFHGTENPSVLLNQDPNELTTAIMCDMLIEKQAVNKATKKKEERAIHGVHFLPPVIYIGEFWSSCSAS